MARAEDREHDPAADRVGRAVLQLPAQAARQDRRRCGSYGWNLEQFLVFFRNRDGRLARVTDLTASAIQAWMDDMAAEDLRSARCGSGSRRVELLRLAREATDADRESGGEPGAAA